MNKKDFLDILGKGLSNLPEQDRKEILYDYEEHFNIGSENGKSEDEISVSLGNPTTLAKEFNINYMINKAENERTTTSIFSAVFATLSLGLFNLIFVLGPFLATWAVVFSLFIASFSFSLGGVVLFLGSFVGFLGMVNIPFYISVGVVFLGIGFFALGALFSIGVYYLAKGLYILTIKYLKFNMKIIIGRRMASEKST